MFHDGTNKNRSVGPKCAPFSFFGAPADFNSEFFLRIQKMNKEQKTHTSPHPPKKRINTRKWIKDVTK